jgi:cell division protein FtsX
MLKVTDTGVFTFYVLGIVTVLAVIGFEIRSAIIKNNK